VYDLPHSASDDWLLTACISFNCCVCVCVCGCVCVCVCGCSWSMCCCDLCGGLHGAGVSPNTAILFYVPISPDCSSFVAVLLIVYCEKYEAGPI
jgi:hypothetical protein